MRIPYILLILRNVILINPLILELQKIHLGYLSKLSTSLIWLMQSISPSSLASKVLLSLCSFSDSSNNCEMFLSIFFSFYEPKNKNNTKFKNLNCVQWKMKIDYKKSASRVLFYLPEWWCNALGKEIRKQRMI